MRSNLKYPFTFEEWQKHPSSKSKIKWCKRVGAEIDKIIKASKEERKIGTQLSMQF